MNGNFTLLQMSSGHECQFHIANNGQEWQFHIAKITMTSNGQEWQFHIFHFATDI